MKSAALRIDQPLGMDERWRTQPAAASRIVDMRWDPVGAWETAGGFAPIPTSAGFAGWGAIRSMFWFSQHNGGRQWTVFEGANPTTSTYDLVAYTGWGGGGWSTIHTSRTNHQGPWQGTQYASIGNWMYFINGEDEPSRWNGAERTRIGFPSAPPAPLLTYQQEEDLWLDYRETSYNDPRMRGVGAIPVLVAASGATVTSRWVYSYAVTWVNDLGMESPASAIATVIGASSSVEPAVAGSGKRFVKVLMPAAPPNVRGMRLYRSENLYQVPVQDERQVTLYLHSTYAYGGEMSFMDGKPDSELGSKLDSGNLGAFPSGARYLALFKGTLFVATDKTVRYSAPLLIEQFPLNNEFHIGSRDAGEITGFYATRDALVVFKRRGIYTIRGNPVTGFSVDTLTEDVGCASPNAIVDVPGRGLLFLADEGVYLLAGAAEAPGTPTRVEDISKKIQKTWRRRVNKSALIAAVAVVNHPDKEVWIQLPADGDDRTKLGLVYHYEIGEWSLREGWPVSCFAETQDHRSLLLFGSWDDASHDGIHHYSMGYSTKNGTALLSTYESGHIDFGNVWGKSLVAYVQPQVVTQGNRALTVNFRIDRRVAYYLSSSLSHNQIDTESARPFWDTDTWSATALYSDYDPVPVVYSIGTQHAHEFSVRFQSSRMRLLSYVVGVTPGKDKPNFIKLEAGLGLDKT